MKLFEDVIKDPECADKIIKPGQKFAYRVTRGIFSEFTLVHVGGVYALIMRDNGLAFKDKVIESDSKYGVTVSQIAELIGPEEISNFRLM